MLDVVVALLLVAVVRSLFNSADSALVPARSILAVILTLVLLSRLA